MIAGNHSLQTELADLRFQYEKEKENSELERTIVERLEAERIKAEALAAKDADDNSRVRDELASLKQ